MGAIVWYLSSWALLSLLDFICCQVYISKKNTSLIQSSEKSDSGISFFSAGNWDIKILIVVEGRASHIFFPVTLVLSDILVTDGVLNVNQKFIWWDLVLNLWFYWKWWDLKVGNWDSKVGHWVVSIKGILGPQPSFLGCHEFYSFSQHVLSTDVLFLHRSGGNEANWSWTATSLTMSQIIFSPYRLIISATESWLTHLFISVLLSTTLRYVVFFSFQIDSQCIIPYW